MNLTNYVKQVSQEDFGLSFKHEAFWNKRLRTSGGRFFPGDGHLDFNPKIYQEHGLAVFRQIVRHELCHYHLYFAKKGYRHRDQDFKDLLAQVDGLRFTPTLSQQGPVHSYHCQTCHALYQRKRRLDTRKFVCGVCQGRLVYQNRSYD